MPKINKETLFTAGRPIGPLYSQAMKLRAWLYRHNVFKRHHLDVPVISVGNLTMGGTGKTPIVIYLARLLKDRGYRPAVISRGYRGAAGNRVNIVSDGTTLLLSPRDAGDEPYLIASTLPDIVVATGKKRIAPCREVIESYGCDAIILDDAFQHLSIARSVDLVLFDVNHFAGNSRVFPAGELREPVSALRRCSAFLLTGTTEKNQERAAKCADLLTARFPDKPVVLIGRYYSHAIKYSPSDTGYQSTIIACSDIPANLFCFCGIAHSERFQASLSEHGVSCCIFKSYSDHYAYTRQDMSLLLDQATAAGAPGFLTTQKDMTKIQTLPPGDLPIFTPVLDIPRNDQLDTLVLDLVQAGRLPSSARTT